MTLALNAPCKVNLLLNILGRRPDGFHALETLLQPVAVEDRLEFRKGGVGIKISCTEPSLAVDACNLVHKAATAFLAATGINDGVCIHLVKVLPMAAGLGGGSANAAVTLLGLNRLFENPASRATLEKIAATLGSDVPFFLQGGPALGTGRGEQIQPIEPFASLRHAALLLVRPGFGVSTPWAYSKLSDHPDMLNGRPGRALDLAERLRTSDLPAAGRKFFNSLEAPVFRKYPLLEVLKEFLLSQDAMGALLSGSGSTTFAIMDSMTAAETLREKVLGRFGSNLWTAIAPL
jgi:4-diphosphocytidyl-2-C-methyl-D-erythritol kinase